MRKATEASTAADATRADPLLERKLDIWGAQHRVVAAILGLGVSLLVIHDYRWMAVTCLVFLVFAAAVAAWLARHQTGPLYPRIRRLLLVVDVTVVATLCHAWGTDASPISFMFVPIVVGWTLVPEGELGALALALSLLMMGSLLLGEHLGVLQRAPAALDAQPGLAGGPLVFFALLTAALSTAHGMVRFTVARLHEHLETVAQLRAVQAANERELELVGELQEAMRLEALGRLAGGVAHDFNNLLMAIMGYADLGRSQLPRRPDAALNTLQQIEATAERAARLTHQLLDFARRAPTSPGPVDVNQAVELAAPLLSHLSKPGVVLRVDPSPEPAIVRADAASLERVLLNLVIHANEAMPEGGELRIDVEVGDEVRIRVSDTGVGIAAEDLPHVFEPFFTTRQLGRSTGLGLASVYGLIKQLGGHVEVGSELGRGTCFDIRLPRCQEAPSTERTSLAPPREELALDVLVVDDDETVRTIIRTHLEQAGARVLEAASGDEALSIYEHHPRIGVVVSDVSMPGMNGIVLAHELRRRTPTLPLLLVSGYATDDLVTHGAPPPGVRLLSKPFSRDALISAVHACRPRRSALADRTG